MPRTWVGRLVGGFCRSVPGRRRARRSRVRSPASGPVTAPVSRSKRVIISRSLSWSGCRGPQPPRVEDEPRAARANSARISAATNTRRRSPHAAAEALEGPTGRRRGGSRLRPSGQRRARAHSLQDHRRREREAQVSEMEIRDHRQSLSRSGIPFLFVLPSCEREHRSDQRLNRSAGRILQTSARHLAGVPEPEGVPAGTLMRRPGRRRACRGRP